MTVCYISFLNHTSPCSLAGLKLLYIQLLLIVKTLSDWLLKTNSSSSGMAIKREWAVAKAVR